VERNVQNNKNVEPPFMFISFRIATMKLNLVTVAIILLGSLLFVSTVHDTQLCNENFDLSSNFTTQAKLILIILIMLIYTEEYASWSI
jgi:fumarate reductase subunit D